MYIRRAFLWTVFYLSLCDCSFSSAPFNPTTDGRHCHQLYAHFNQPGSAVSASSFGSADTCPWCGRHKRCAARPNPSNTLPHLPAHLLTYSRTWGAPYRYSIVWQERPVAAVILFIFYVLFQFGLCMGLGCDGVSIIWCACIGACIMPGYVLRPCAPPPGYFSGFKLGSMRTTGTPSTQAV